MGNSSNKITYNDIQIESNILSEEYNIKLMRRSKVIDIIKVDFDDGLNILELDNIGIVKYIGNKVYYDLILNKYNNTVVEITPSSMIREDVVIEIKKYLTLYNIAVFKSGIEALYRVGLGLIIGEKYKYKYDYIDSKNIDIMIVEIIKRRVPPEP